ncbi:MAG: terpene cyclase/mutase family protein [Myxococcales bacterium]|nr:terpene cyclase/mutase family protein [Myxococcales bacterium]
MTSDESNNAATQGPAGGSAAAQRPEKHPWLALVDAFGLCLVTAFALFVLPARYLPFDVPLGVLAATFLVSALALLRGGQPGARVAAWAAGARIVLGLGFMVLLALTAADITGRFGAVGPVGVGFMAFGVALFLPYLVVFPALQVGYLAARHGGPPGTLGRRLRRLLAASASVLVVAFAAGRALAVGHAVEPPSDATMQAAFAAVRGTGELPEHVAAGPVVVELVRHGRVRAQHIGTESLRETLASARERFFGLLPSEGAWVISVPTRRSRPSPLPWLSLLQLAPLHDGVLVRRAGALAIETPTTLQLIGAHVAVPFAPMPVFQFGTDLEAIVARLQQAPALAPAGAPNAAAQGSPEVEVELLRFRTYTDPPYRDASRRRPLPDASEERVRAAIHDSVDFILRHQRFDGVFAYQVDAARGLTTNAGYDFTRHAGVAYFLAQAGHELGLSRATEGAQRGVSYLLEMLQPCGPAGARCIVTENGPEFGATALLAVALYDLRSAADTPELAALHHDLLAFIVQQQRPDGELMHGYDLLRQEPIDVQLMYFSGEGALALVRGAALTGDAQLRDAAQRLLRYLAVDSRRALGEPYLFEEEHWTCIAYGEYRTLLRAELPAVGDFCQRWAAFSRRVQYQPGETVWDVTGAYGLGPIIPAQITGTASRTEAFAALAGGEEPSDPALVRQVERGVQALLQHQFLPGPTHLMSRPDAMRGGMTGAPGDLVVRNDYVQHAGSAYIRYLAARF